MADNVKYTEPGTGTVFATLDVGGTHHQKVLLEGSAGGTPTLLSVDSTGSLEVHPQYLISTNNSTTATLGSGAAFTGTSDDVAAYGTALVSVIASHDSAASGLQLQQSSNGTNWDNSDAYSYVTANGNRLYTVGLVARYFRVVFTNGGTGQSSFRLSTIFKTASVRGSSHRLGDSVVVESDAELVRAVLTAQTDGGTSFDSLKRSSGGALFTGGDIPHGTTDAGNPVKLGAKAVAHGANPSAVAAGARTDLYANRHGVQFVLGGHPGLITRRDNYTALQTDVAIVGSISTGTKVAVTQIQVTADNAMTATPSVIIGFGATNTPTGVGVVVTHPGLPGGGGVTRGDGSGLIGVGADGEELRITMTVPTGGSISVVTTYFLIES